MSERFENFLWTVGIIFVSFLFLGLIWYWSCVGFIDNYEYGFVYNKWTGQIEKPEHNGWIVLNPFVKNLHKIDLRPCQVAMNANSRILNAKLVKFNIEGLAIFLEWHGREAGDNHLYLIEILKSYAFDRDNGIDCPFLTIISEMAPDKTNSQGKTK